MKVVEEDVLVMDGVLVASDTNIVGSGSSSSSGSVGFYKSEICMTWEEFGHCRYGSKCQVYLSAALYNMLSAKHIQANLLQTGAVILQLCADDIPEKIESLSLEASRLFDVEVEKNLTLLTIRHYKKELLEKMIKGRKIVLQQWSPDTVQTLMY